MKKGQDKQCALLLRALGRRPMTALEILAELGIARAAARVYDLKREGWNIGTEFVQVRNRQGELCRVARYTLLQTQGSLVPMLERTLRVAA